ncbi:hypothetical protein C2S51_038076 [Perilla frutescens var. frutescens]|nr:hypothetical protein C2S51_038076 [Perilla frutescens var. frutescens]
MDSNSTSIQPRRRYYMAANAYIIAEGAAFINISTTSIVSYSRAKRAASSTPIMPILPPSTTQPRLL